MRILFTTVLVVFLSLNCFSGEINSKQIGPGVIHHHDYISNGPWHINVLEIDLTNEWISLETVKANDRIAGNEQTSSMCKRQDREAYRIVGAVNGDFYETGGVPIGAQIINGELLKRPYPRSAFAYSSDGGPVIDIFSFQGNLFTKNNNSLLINGINEVRNTDNLIVYNRYFGDRTSTNQWGTEITGMYVDQKGMVNDTVKIFVTEKDSLMLTGHGNAVIPAHGIILSGHGVSSEFLNNNVFIGDTLRFIMQLPPSNMKLKTMIGGMPRIIRNGAVSVEWLQETIRESFCSDRHPRTAVGFSHDSTTVYFFTVDGRQPGYSIGMSLYQLADYMIEWGVYQGVNLDGGGSTTMVARGNVVNSPSDGSGERAVANGLMVISSAPTAETAHLQILPENVHVAMGNQIQFSVKAFDMYYNPDPVDQDTIYTWSCDTMLGSFNETGIFTAGNDMLAGYIYVQSSTIKDSSLVTITAETQLKLENTTGAIPCKLKLYDNYPNPFNPNTTIKFELEKNALTEVNIYDISGRFIRSLLNELLTIGTHQIEWDGRSNSGKHVSSGTYFYQVKTNNQNSVRKMLLIK